MRKVTWIAAGALTVALAAGGVAAAAGGPWALNGRAQGYGPGMMGRGGMMGGGCQGVNGADYDPAAMLAHAEAMLAQHQTRLTSLEARLAAEQDEGTKAILTARIERENLMIGWFESRIPVLEKLPEEWLEGGLALAHHDVDYFTGATATDPYNQAFIAQRLATAQQRLAWLEEQAEQQS